MGRNGSGKSSLMKIISGQYELTSGQNYIAPGANIAYLEQDPKLDLNQNIYQFILGKDLAQEKYKADIILSQLELDGNWHMDILSGGQLRRSCLAKVLVNEPDILLLDEPTNHLDIRLIEWLEDMVKAYRGTIVCISHDRRFLSNVTNKVWWLDRARIRKSDKGFKYFEQWQEDIIEQETKELQKLNKKLQMEDHWLSYGVTARRKRNQKRLTALIALREQLRGQKLAAKSSKNKIQADLEEARKNKFIIKATNIGFGYGAKKLISDFNITIQKGEKIGVIGPNGTGKTTLLKLLLGFIEPDAGKIKHGTELRISYLDQARKDLNPNDTLQEVLCPGGGSYVEIAGRDLHVASYLKQFMFDPKLLSTKACILSGGEAARLLLAKMLIKPGNLLVLDEPTNDLDMDTIEILLEILFDYNGTCIIVSHDRDFLDRLVNRTLVFSENGNIVDCIGGYQDYKQFSINDTKINKVNNNQKVQTNILPPKPTNKKLSYKYQRELEILPQEIKTLEQEIANIENLLLAEDLFLRDPGEFNQLSIHLQDVKKLLDEKINLWFNLSEIN